VDQEPTQQLRSRGMRNPLMSLSRSGG
jgi:hypothetical protein